MQIPFTTDQFFDVMRQYHQSVAPMEPVLYAVGLMGAGVAIRVPQRGNLVLASVALLWAWMTVVYHLMFFTSINPMAYAFAAMFLVEAALIAWHTFRSRRLRLSREVPGPLRALGLALIVYALLLYPVVGYLLGQRYPALPTFGLPCPTLIYTLGILLWCAPPVPWSVLIIPAVWAAIGTSAAVSFGVGEDYALLPAVAVAIVALAWQRKVPELRAA